MQVEHLILLRIVIMIGENPPNGGFFFWRGVPPRPEGDHKNTLFTTTSSAVPAPLRLAKGNKKHLLLATPCHRSDDTGRPRAGRIV